MTLLREPASGIGDESPMPDDGADHHRRPDSSGPPPAGVMDAARRLIDEGGDAAHSARATAQALKTLAQAEWALAKAAIVRGALLGAFALIGALLGTGFLLATLAATLVALGLGWPAALAISTGLVLLTSGLLGWRAARTLQLARFDTLRHAFDRLREDRPWV